MSHPVSFYIIQSSIKFYSTRVSRNKFGINCANEAKYRSLAGLQKNKTSWQRRQTILKARIILTWMSY